MAKKVVKDKASNTVKRNYCTDVLKKIDEGKRWRLQLDIDNDNAVNIITEIEGSIAGGEYNKVINNIVRMHYASKKKKK